MNKPSNPLSPKDEQGNWLNKPVSSIIGGLLGKSSKGIVPDAVIALHNREIMDSTVFAKTAQAIDSTKFTQPEFILLLKIRYCLDRGIEDYAGLAQSVKYLQAAIEAKNSFFLLAQTELRYRSSKQQEFYQHIQSILDMYQDREFFKESVHAKLLETLPSVKTEEGKTALQNYEKEIDRLSEYELGLKLFSLFKQYQLADYSMLRSISDMVSTFQERDTMNSKVLSLLVVEKFDMFSQLGKIIGLTGPKNTPDNYAKMLQYIALESRHKKSYLQFKDFISVMKKWMRHYQAILKIRQEYPPQEYKQPKEFSAEIPGEDLYNKYRGALTDKRTGNTYFEVEG